ncbi:hypothetical protein EI534_28505 [Pseudomonas frederiksbergensis]|nr:hypothetical protein [Pseudomonas frederiksbergensis]
MWLRGLLWRGGLPPLGCEAAPEPPPHLILTHRIDWLATAAQPNGGKPPRHKSSPAQCPSSDDLPFLAENTA